MYKNLEEKILAIENYIEALENYINECEEFQEHYKTNSLEFNIEKSKERIEYYQKILNNIRIPEKVN